MFVLLHAALACAQVELGENLKMHLNGSAGFGYGGGFGDPGGSSHSTTVLGNANFTGSYFNPNFLSFDIQPYYNRSQGSSETQSLFSGNGVTGTVRLFNGSRFPGSISFNRDVNSTAEIGVPGVAGFTAEGSSHGMQITWAALLPKLPTLEATFATTGNSSSILGAAADATSSSKNFNLNSTYKVAGWTLLGNFNHQNQTMELPGFLAGGNEAASFSSTENAATGYGVTAQHALPLSGSLSVGANHWTYGGDGNAPSSATNFNVGTGITPISTITISSSMNYTTNAYGALARSIITEGLPMFLLDNTSHALSLNNTAYIAVGHGFTLQGYMNYHTQSFRNQDFSDSQYGGTVSYRYSRPVLGMLYLGFSMVDTANKEGNTGLGMVGTASLSRRVGRWETSADFGYSQNVQTLVSTYTTSSYSYGASLRRQFNEVTHWSASYRASHSGLVQYEGNSSGTQAISTNFSWKRYGVGAAYAQSDGTTVLTPSGLLAPTPLIGLVTNDFLVFNGKSYSLTATAMIFRRIFLSGNYVKVNSETLAQALHSFNDGERYNARLEYRVRKLSIRGNYYRVKQDISASGILPSVVNSFQIEITRWFNVF